MKTGLAYNGDMSSPGGSPQTGLLQTSLLQTKLHAPKGRAALVPRPRLIAKLDEALSSPLTLISAPAGFGKTSLVLEWQAQSQQPMAWLSLEADDSEPNRFLDYLVAALQTLDSTVGQNLLPLLQSPQPPPIKTMLAPVLGDLNRLTQPALVVLDDYHVIQNQAIHEALVYLIDHLPPQLRIILTTRSDPPLTLALWRVRGQLGEVRADDLRFTPEEAQAFLSGMGISLNTADVVALDTRTEGWIAGLQLAALSMKGRSDIAGFIQSFTGSNRYIGSFLVEEVLSRQPEAVQDFLLQTSILERLSGELCDALTGHSDGRQMLEHLLEANLFLIPLDDSGNWYRYHHLFADVLQARLRQTRGELVVELHLRASQWFEQQGFLYEAINHAAGVDVSQAATIIETHAEAMFAQGELARLRTWLSKVPTDLLESRPKLSLIYGIVLATTGRLHEAQRLLRDTRALFEAPDLPPDIQGWLAQHQAHMARLRGDLSEAADFYHLALKHLPLSAIYARSIALVNLATVYIRMEDDPAAQATLEHLDPADHFAKDNLDLLLGWKYAHQGKLSIAAAKYQQVLTSSQSSVRAMGFAHFRAMGVAHLGMAHILYERNDLPGAEISIRKATELLRNTVEQRALAHSYGLLSRIRSAKEVSSDSLGPLKEAEQWLEETQIGDLALREIIATYRTALAMRQGRVQEWSRGTHWGDIESVPPVAGWQDLIMARGLILQREFAAAVENLAELLAKKEKRNWVSEAIGILILQAVAFDSMGQTAQSKAALQRALMLGEPEGFCRSFVDEGKAVAELLRKLPLDDPRLKAYREHLLSAFAQAPVQPLPEGISPRELEVLKLIASGASNPEICEQLGITANTLKRHINSLFGKLGVDSRTRALVAAKELGLL